MKLAWLLASLVSLSLVSIVPIQHADGQCRVNEAAKLTASDGAPLDRFGVSVSVSGDVAVIGAWEDDDAGTSSGSAYVYRFDGGTWVEEQKLTASDAAFGDRFGASASIGGDVAVVGSIWDDDAGHNSGSAYVYRFDGGRWVEEQKLTASNAVTDSMFGYSVSISGDAAIVGAPHFNVAAIDSGSAHVYRFDGVTWVEEQKLTASDAALGDRFGTSVAISGDVAMVGSFSDDDAGTSSGSAYVYRFDGGTWVEEQKLTAPNAAEGDIFGFSVSISGDVGVVGSTGDDDGGKDSGSAYVYRFDGSTWCAGQKLTTSDAAAADRFGYAVSVSGSVAVVGANPFGNQGRWPGSAYVFGINLIPSDPPCGAIDARQPSAPDGSDPAGWDSIAMTFDEPPGDMNPEDFAVVISPPGDAPTVTVVTVDGNTATVHFDAIIATEAWTTLTHWPTGAVTRIGYLPADVNNDKLSNANDVLFLIDVLNGIIDPTPPAYQTDTDRSGATNASDVLRVIDLLNGAATYDEHLGAELPA